MNKHYIKQILTIVLLSLLSLSASAREVVIPEGTVSIDADSGYRGDTTITSVVIPNSVTEIGWYAFSDCTGLASVVIEDGVTEIGSCAFSGCAGLTSVVIPNSVTSIGNRAFSGCTGLTSVEIPNSVTRIEGDKSGGAFSDCTGLTSVEIPNSVSYLSGFSGCTGLTSVVIEDGVTEIGFSAFESCTGLTSVEIPSSVTEIGQSAFSGCTALENVEIPSSVTKIGSYAFYGCIVSLPYDLWAKNNSIGKKIRFTTAPDTVDCLNKSFEYLDLPENVKYVKNYNEIGTLDASLRLYCEGSYNSQYVKNFYHDGVNVRELKSIVIPDGTTKIKSYVFGGCTSLTSVEIPSSVTEIGSHAFSGCTALENVEIPSSVTKMGSYAFYGCIVSFPYDLWAKNNSIGEKIRFTTAPDTVDCLNKSFEYLDLPENVKYVKNYNKIGTLDASLRLYCEGSYNSRYVENFYHDGVNIKELKSIVIPDGTTKIKSSAFESCTGLTSVEIPSSVTEIGQSAFSGCTALENVEIPSSVAKIGSSAFSDCIVSLLYDLWTKNNSIGEKIRFTTAPDTVDCLNKSFKYLDLPESVKYVKNYNEIGTLDASLRLYCEGSYNSQYVKNFYHDGVNVWKLKSIVIPDGTTKIKSSAFSGRTSLASVEIPSSVTEIGSSAFKGCTGLTSVVIEDGVTEIGSSAFEDCTGLTSVEIPNSVTKIGSYAFFGCTGLTSVVIEDGVTEIGEYAFSGCTGLTSVVIPNSVTYLSGFSGCTGLTSVEIPSSVTVIGSHAFKGCTGLTSVVIEDGVTEIGEYAFSGCTGLTSVVIPNSVTKIGSSAFSGCTGLTSVVIPNSVTKIGSSAFESCTGLTSVEIPSSVTVIGSSAFEDCTGLTSVVIEGGVTEIGSSAFKGCTGLTSVVIEDGVTKIGSSAFEDCTGLTSVEIPGSVTSIRYYAFYGCTGLTSVVIEDGVTEIGGYAFSGCTGLTSIVIPNSVTEIGYSAFKGCTSLTSVEIPGSVTEIGDHAFDGCDDLKKITCLSNIPPTMSEKSFPSFMAYLYVPCESYSKYDLHEIWGQFKHIECVGAETIVNPITNVEIQPGIDDAYFTWPVTSNAESYTLKINKDGEVLCTLIFNANGQLTSIDFSGLRSGTTGFQFNVTGLREDSQYTYSMEAKDADNNVLKSYSGEFKTLKKGDGVEDIYDEKIPIAVNGETISIDAEENLMISIFDMKGQCLYKGFGNVVFKAPTSGVYVVKYGSFATKVVVK